jgi:hypothetical protein
LKVQEEAKTEEITVKTIQMLPEEIHNLMVIPKGFRLLKEQNRPEIILKTEEIQRDSKALKARNVTKLQEQVRSPEAVNHKEKAVRAAEAVAAEEFNIKIAFPYKNQKHNLTIVLFFIFLVIIEVSLF